MVRSAPRDLDRLPPAVRRRRPTFAMRRAIDGASASSASVSSRLVWERSPPWRYRSRRIRSNGARPRRTRPGLVDAASVHDTGWESLTPTELQVAELVAEGQTNPQIAQHLLMGRATVKTHLEHVFTKLGVKSRAELAAMVVSRRQP